jgi:hypothetical protein
MPAFAGMSGEKIQPLRVTLQGGEGPVFLCAASAASC